MLSRKKFFPVGNLKHCYNSKLIAFFAFAHGHREQIIHLVLQHIFAYYNHVFPFVFPSLTLKYMDISSGSWKFKSSLLPDYGLGLCEKSSLHARDITQLVGQTIVQRHR